MGTSTNSSAARPWDADSLDLYMADLGHLPGPLSREEAKEVARRAQAGDEKARELLITANLRFVISYVKRFRGRGLPLQDLVALGNEGLITAADRFDAEAGTKFISYAVWWVRQVVLKGLAEQAGAVRVPLNTNSAQNAEIRRAGRLARSPAIGLEEPLYPEPGSPTLLDRLVGPNGIEHEVERKNLRQQIDQAIQQHLPPRERWIVVRYYGLDGGERLTLQALADHFGLSRERIRQLRNRGLKLLRKALPPD